MWYRIKAFVRFYLGAKTKFNVHSPFLYDLLTNVLDTSKEYYAYGPLENMRHQLQKDDRLLRITDLGAGSMTLSGKEREVKSIASTSLSGSTKCRILFNLADHYGCRSVLELGTSLGVSSAYLASSSKNAIIKTLEGDPAIADIARQVHSQLSLSNIEVVTGAFGLTLENVLVSMTKPDLVFLDGHHQREPLLRYYEKILGFCHENTIVVVDDIYWSADMEEAWKQLISRPEVTLSVDLFEVGILFFRKSLSKENYRIFPFKYKPWKIGLFG